MNIMLTLQVHHTPHKHSLLPGYASDEHELSAVFSTSFFNLIKY